jgi:hypothetical protein
MSLVITGTELTIILFLLIGLNGFFCYKRFPILAIPISGVSFLFMFAFNIDFSGFTIILSLLVIIFSIINLVLNISDTIKK